MKILMSNNHVPYIFMLAETGHDIFVLNPEGREWDLRMRPIPPNVRIIDGARNIMTFINELKRNPLFFDRVILQDSIIKTNDSIDFYDRLIYNEVEAPKIMLFHISFQTQFRGLPKDKEGIVRQMIAEKLKGIKPVYISEFKMRSWGIPGDVVVPGFESEMWGGWNGKGNYVLSCLNNAMHRNFMNNTVKMKMTTADLNWKLLGEENGQGVLARDLEDLKNHYRFAKWYLCLNNPEYEDGYNLSMLEAMATGCPAITLEHFSSPILHGINGLKSNDLQELNYMIHNTSEEDIVKMGRKAKETALNLFQMEHFVDTWNEILEMG
ncbi:MAG: hypothetical protein KKD77_21475 [Gammaproteobacteria bacterium]|nr:hypothetical protein [Gammaproteobacteria bacterium]